MKLSLGPTLILCLALMTSGCRLKIETFTKKSPKTDGVDLPNINWPALRLVSAGKSNAGVPFDSFNYSAKRFHQNKLLFATSQGLIPADTNLTQDLYTIDLVTKDIALISSDSSGVPGNDKSYDEMSFSPDGTRILFTSLASNLVTGDTNDAKDLFLKDLSSGDIIRVNSASDGSQMPGCLGKFGFFHPTGNFVAFHSDSTCDGSSNRNLYVKNLQTHELIRVTSANYDVYPNGFSLDGQHLVFLSSASNLVAGDTNGKDDYFVSTYPFDGSIPLQRLGINQDGFDYDNGYWIGTMNSSVVALSSEASNVIPGDSNGVNDVFVLNLQSGAVERVSTNANGDWSDEPMYLFEATPDGRYVIMYSNDNPSLDPTDTNSELDIFIKDRQTGELKRVSAYGLLNPGERSFPTQPMELSPDGTKLIINYYRETADPTIVLGDFYVLDVATGTINPTTINSNAQGVRSQKEIHNSPIFSADSSKIYFFSEADDLVPGDDNEALDLFVKTISTGAIERIEFPTNEEAKAADEHVDEGAAIAAGKVAFSSTATNLTPDGGNGNRQLYVHDVQAGTVTVESLGTDGSLGDGDSGYPHLSRDGKKLLFTSCAGNLTPMDSNGKCDIFLKDLATGTIKLVSVAANGDQTDGNSYDSVLSLDGQKVYFVSEATNLIAGDTNNDKDIFEKNLRTGAVRRITTQAEQMQLSKDGKKLVYQSWRSTVAGAQISLFVQDLETGLETLVSSNSNGNPLLLWSLFGDISPRGDEIAFFQADVDAVQNSGDFSSVKSFIKNLTTGELTRIDLKPDQTPYNGYTALPMFGPEGRFLYFVSTSNEITADPSSGRLQIYQKDLSSGVITKVSTNLNGEEADGLLSFQYDISPDGKALVMVGEPNNLVPHDQPGVRQVFLKRLVD